MDHLANTTPIFLSFNHIDPSGAGGIQTDIETAVSLGCHCTPIATTSLVSDTKSTTRYQATKAALIIEQARTILLDMPVMAFHIGSVGSIENIEAIHSIIRDYPKIPVVINYTNASMPLEQATEELKNGIDTLLLPLCQIVIIAGNQCREIASHADTDDACAASILEMGSEFLLTHHANKHLSGSSLCFYSLHGLIQQYHSTTLQHQDEVTLAHLASAISGYLAHQLPISDTIQQSLRYTENAFKSRRHLGHGNPIYHRLFWSQKD